MPTTLRRVGFLLALALAIAYAYAPLWSAGNVGDDVPTLIDASRLAWPSDSRPAPSWFSGVTGEREPPERPIEELSIALSGRAWSSAGNWSGAEARCLRAENLALWIAVAVLAGMAARRAFLPWLGSEPARAAGAATAAFLAIHPLAVPAVAYLGSRGDLIASALCAASASAFLRARQERGSMAMFAAGASAVLAAFASHVAWLLPPALAGLEFGSARRYRPMHVKVRTALTTLVCFGVLAAGAAAWEAAHGATPGEVRDWMAFAREPGDLLQNVGAGLSAIAAPRVSGAARPLTIALSLCVLAFALHPAIVAFRSAPRSWTSIAIAIVAGVGLALAAAIPHVDARAEWERATAWIPLALAIASALGATSTALSGWRRDVLPCAVVAVWAWMGREAAAPFPPAARAWNAVRSDLARARELHGREARFLLVDPPRAPGELGSPGGRDSPSARDETRELDPIGATLPSILEPCFVGEAPRGERTWVRGASRSALFALVHEPEFRELCASGLVLVLDADLLDAPDAPPPSGVRGRVSLVIPPPESGGDAPVWRAEGRSPLLDLDPREHRALRVSALADAIVSEPPRAAWRAREGEVATGVRLGTWVRGEDGPVALFDLSRSIPWLCSRSVRRVWFEGALANIASAKFLTDASIALPATVPEVRDDAWCFRRPEVEMPRVLNGDAEWYVCLLDLEAFHCFEVRAEGAPGAELCFPGAALFERGIFSEERAAGSGALAWSLEYRAGDTVLARASGRRREAASDVAPPPR